MEIRRKRKMNSVEIRDGKGGGMWG
ncbi:hypothetical protein CCACVL1_05091 [Corchorus capsularis]|uniref:Uncharacterized protein n=1 Tax=Corchorus capsularis TaxID=210143 RepID=A0A1R3JMT4_COCAP|nr:hypothetical protein CCACVL1_05091 [Corchorus capsularis]